MGLGTTCTRGLNYSHGGGGGIKVLLCSRKLYFDLFLSLAEAMPLPNLVVLARYEGAKVSGHTCSIPHQHFSIEHSEPQLAASHLFKPVSKPLGSRKA